MNSVTWVLIDQRLNHLLCEHLSSNLLGVSRCEKYGEDRQDKERDRVKPRWTNLADVPWRDMFPPFAGTRGNTANSATVTNESQARFATFACVETASARSVVSARLSDSVMALLLSPDALSRA